MMSELSIWRTSVLVLAGAPLAYYVVAIFATLRFFRRERARRLTEFAPPVSLLKPVRGVDFASYENFKSFCTQNYPDYEILFCVNERNDPAVPVIERVMREFPQRTIRILSGAEQIGSNRKVNNLVLLAKEARHEILVQSDGDVRVGPEYLREVVAPFADNAVGVVSCFYRGVAERNFWAEVEAVGAASDFFAGALVANLPGEVTFALGASVATTKAWLAKIGGYEGLADLLADDYEIGNRVHRAGGKVLLSREAVWTMYPAQSLKGFWEHQVRWARTVRLVRPASFFGLLITHGLPWCVLAAAVAPSAWVGAGFLSAYLVLRLLMAWVVGVWGVNDGVLRLKLWLVPLRDAIHFTVWLAGFTSNRVKWGGVEYAIDGGRMREVRSTGD
ncbi:MAG TPA: bacteriohopanetetrol glucosamine biosynthesis glycosyltransferase HpnI [Candidatus Acidoferrales bacterium]|jgi:ceramide glucosyltransferase|nr:bacteriohopanetetrol glucosamine biosynthesis glycosyltransferase HpnI [Candidatus Acidoferrales bacterium]